MQKTREEIDQMSPAELAAYKVQQRQVVFGEDVKMKSGKPVEQGIGAPGRETENHFRAIRKAEGVEAEKAAREAAKAHRKKASA